MLAMSMYTPSLRTGKCVIIVIINLSIISNVLRSRGFAGVIPIDRLTDVRAPAAVIASRIPRAQLESAYAMHLPRPAPHEDPNR